MKAIRRFNVRSVLPEAISELGELAINLRWSWHTASRNLFAETEPVRWEKVGHDPVALLSSLSAKELERLAAENRNLIFVPVYTETQGRVSAATLRQHVADIAAPRYYLAGPEGMVKAMRALLDEVGADEDNIRTEEFDGY